MKDGKTFKVINPASFKEGSIIKCVRYASEGTSYFDVVEGESHHGRDTDIADSFSNLELIEEKEMNCKSKGYEEGQVFEVLPNSGPHFSDGSIIVLIKDDGSDCPRFGLAKGHCTNGNKSYFNLSDIKRIYPPENTVTIEINGQKTEISLESAKALKKVLEGV